MDLSVVVRIIFAYIASTCFVSTFSGAYPTPVDFDGRLMRWDIDADAEPITYRIKSTNEDLASIFQYLIDDAAAQWSEVPTSYLALAPALDDESSAQITINLEAELTDAPYSAGYSVFDEFDDFAPKHCSIHIATAQNASLTALGKTALHEIGHCLGLGHSLIPEAIMSYRLEKNRFRLDLDDQAALSRLYPADGSKPQLPPGCAIAAGSERVGPFAAFCLLILPLLSLFPACARSSEEL